MPVVESSTIGKTVVFQSIHPSDGRSFKGIVTGIFSYTHALKLSDIIPYHAAVVQANPSIESDPNKLTYFSLKMESSQDEVVMSNAYIVSGSFSIVDISATVIVEIIEPIGSDHTKIVSLLKEAGYINTRLVSTT